jgi:outer membrane protein assembly factor BamA
MLARTAFMTLCLTLGCGNAIGDPLQGTDERMSEPARAAGHARHTSFIVMPIPISDPAIGTGLAGVAMALYNADAAGKPWTSGLGGLYTDSESWALAAFHRSHHDNDRYRVSAAGGYGDFNVDFYGIGADAGSRGVAIGLEQSGIALVFEGLMRARPHTYLGFRYRGVVLDTAITNVDLPFSDLQLPEIELESTVSALGLAAEYDTRDNEFAPHRGVYLEAAVLYAGDAFGSDFEYPRVEAALNGYHQFGGTTLAWRGSVCWAGDGAPFYDICNYGQGNDLRGYPAGQYRDHAMFAAQAELRRHLFWRFGATAFVGVGGVAPDFSDFDGDALLPAAGVGVRFEASRRYRVNLSVDYAVGDDSEAVYFYVGEAF